MDGVKLLEEARIVGLAVNVAGDSLVIRGPRSAAAVARRLLDHKPDVMRALICSVTVTDTAPNAEKIGSNGDGDTGVIRDAWGFPLASGEQLIDPATLTPCPRCNSLEKWWPMVGEPRCQNCDPPTAARKLLHSVENIRKRQGIKSGRRQIEPGKPHCRRCFSTQFVDTKVHGGRSIRRDCAQCGLTAGFPMWWGKFDNRFGAS